VVERSPTVRSVGVGINIQPNAVRELFDLGISAAELDRVGIPVQEWALLGLNGEELYSESRGTHAGYRWPQYAIHRGDFHKLLYELVIDRLGHEAVRLGHKVTGYDQGDVGVTAQLLNSNDDSVVTLVGRVLIGADGIHSGVANFCGAVP